MVKLLFTSLLTFTLPCFGVALIVNNTEELESIRGDLASKFVVILSGDLANVSLAHVMEQCKTPLDFLSFISTYLPSMAPVVDHNNAPSRHPEKIVNTEDLSSSCVLYDGLAGAGVNADLSAINGAKTVAELFSAVGNITIDSIWQDGQYANTLF